MNYIVTLKDKNAVIDVSMGKTILESALDQGIDFPHGCKSGNCGACKSILHGGDVEMSPYSDYALTGEEKGRGLILPCRSVPWSDCEISLIDDDDAVVHASRQLECEIADIIQATHDIRIIRIKILAGGPYNFSAGQYASVTFKDLPPRDYSMANMPDSDVLEFHIRLVPGGAVTPFVQSTLKVGDQVRVQGPYGTAYFRENHKGPIIAAAGGSGLAPIKSILETAFASNAGQPIAFYFGVRDERDVYMAEKFEELANTFENFSFIPVLSEPKSTTERHTGFLADAIANDFQDLDGFKAYLAGPPIMVETTVEKLKSLGIQRSDCHADAFYTEADKMKLEGN
jgi:naphthalene 1,2-dioxygenase ferredoxin reductase component